MAYTLTQSFGGLFPHKIGEFESAEAAIDKANALGAILIWEDADYPGCFDGITKQGAILCIQPKGFKIAA